MGSAVVARRINWILAESTVYSQYLRKAVEWIGKGLDVRPCSETTEIQQAILVTSIVNVSQSILVEDVVRSAIA